jgi:hypothetical protein
MFNIASAYSIINIELQLSSSPALQEKEPKASPSS